jgi:hypothetical protein
LLDHVVAKRGTVLSEGQVNGQHVKGSRMSDPPHICLHV